MLRQQSRPMRKVASAPASEHLRKFTREAAHLVTVSKSKQYRTALVRQCERRREAQGAVVADLPRHHGRHIVDGVVRTEPVFCATQPTINLDPRQKEIGRASCR